MMTPNIILVWLITATKVSSFSFLNCKKTNNPAFILPALENAIDEEPIGIGFFEMKQIPTATSSSRLDLMVECSENGECNVEEMTAMVEELEKLNAECLDATGSSRECNLDAVAARNVLKVALASKVILQQQKQQEEKVTADECDLHSLMNPYAELHNLNDECFYDQTHAIPTSTASGSSTDALRLDRIVECAEIGDCPIGEIVDMIDELERLNAECESALSRECSLDAVEARNILKVALGAQAAAARETNTMIATRLYGRDPKQ